jgi:hypothetical protein
MIEPLGNSAAKKLIGEIMKSGKLGFGSHAYDEMAKDDLDEADVRNVLRGGVCRRAEFETGSWRYLFESMRIAVVIAFRSAVYAVVVTAWRMKKK